MFRSQINQTCSLLMFCLKNNFSATGGPKFAIFGREDLDPLYFDVGNFSHSCFVEWWWLGEGGGGLIVRVEPDIRPFLLCKRLKRVHAVFSQTHYH